MKLRMNKYLYLILFGLTLASITSFGSEADDTIPDKLCSSITDKNEAALCTAKRWCPDCGLNNLSPSEYTIRVRSIRSMSVKINTSQVVQFGRYKGTGIIDVRSFIKNSDSIRLCPTDGGYLIVEGYKTSECVAYPYGKSLGLELSPGLKKLLKTFAFDSISFKRSNGLNKGRQAPYTLLIDSLRIKKGQTVCGIKFDEDTVAMLNTFENDHKIAIRPPKPIVIGGKTYPAWADDSQVYEIFDGEKCANEIRFLKASE